MTSTIATLDDYPGAVSAPSTTGRTAALTRLRPWIVVAAATVGMMAAFALNTTVAVVMKPFESEFGWMRADISFAYALLSAGAALGGVIVGWTMDRIDTRPILVFGALVMAVGFAVLARQSDLATIQIVYLALGIFGFACFYTPLIATVGLWFDRGRGLAMGIVTAGGTLGQGLMPTIAQPMIEATGWRHTFVILAIVYAVALAPLMLLVRKPDAREAPQGRATAAAAGGTLKPAFAVAWLGAGALFCCASMAVPVVHLVTLLADGGRSAGAIGSLMLTMMLAASAGRVGFGIACDRMGALPGYALAVLTQSATVYGFVYFQSELSLYALALVFGFGYGGVMTALSLSVRDAVPARSIGISTSIVGLLAWAGMGLGGFQGGYCFDATGDYGASFAGAALAGAANLVIIGGLALHKRRSKGRLTGAEKSG